MNLTNRLKNGEPLLPIQKMSRIDNSEGQPESNFDIDNVVGSIDCVGKTGEHQGGSPHDHDQSAHGSVPELPDDQGGSKFRAQPGRSSFF